MKRIKHNITFTLVIFLLTFSLGACGSQNKTLFLGDVKTQDLSWEIVQSYYGDILPYCDGCTKASSGNQYVIIVLASKDGKGYTISGSDFMLDILGNEHDSYVLGNDGQEYEFAQTKVITNNKGNVTGWEIAYEIPLGIEFAEWNWPEHSIDFHSDQPVVSPTQVSPTLASFSPSITVPYCDSAIADRTDLGNTFLCISSDTGDYIGNGEQLIISAADADFSTERINQDDGILNVYVQTLSTNSKWMLSFYAPEGEDLLPGVYDNAQSAKSAFTGDFNGFSIYDQFSGRGCSENAGRYEVLEISRDVNNRVMGFAANFEQFCDGATTGLRGYIRYNSSITP
jgi:hypothetical protein